MTATTTLAAAPYRHGERAYATGRETTDYVVNGLNWRRWKKGFRAARKRAAHAAVRLATIH